MTVCALLRAEGRHTCWTQVQHQISSSGVCRITDPATPTRSLSREPQTIFSVCQPKLSPLWLAFLLLLCGDIETNPGPTKSKSTQDSTNKKQIWTCAICTKTITRNQISFQCHNTNHWVHKKCSKITEKDYHIDWTCSLHPTIHNRPTNYFNTSHIPLQSQRARK